MLDKKLFILSPFESLVEARGTRNVFLANIAVSDFKKVCYLTSNFSHGQKRNFEDSELEEMIDSDDGVRFHFIEVPAYKKNISILRFVTHIVFAFKAALFVRHNSNVGDVVLMSSIPPEVLFFNRIFNGNKVVSFCDVRDIWPDAFPGNGILKLFFSWYCSLLYAVGLGNIKQFIYVSPSFKKWIEKFKIESANAVFIPLGFDNERWNPKVEPKEIPTKLKLVYVGYLESQFDISNIVNACTSLEMLLPDQLIFEVVGDGVNEKKYKELDRLGICNFRGRLPPVDTSEIIQDCHVGVLPIVGEAQMPNKLFDFIGAGLPIICFDNNDSAEFIRINDIGWIVQNDPTAIAEIVGAINQKELALKKSNILSLREKYSKEYLYGSYVDLLKTRD